MNQSISNAFLFNLVITFVIILLGFFIGSLSYSKAAKVKNRIIEEIEKNGEIAGAEVSSHGIADKAFESSKGEIDKWLQFGTNGDGIGYRITERGYTNCPTYTVGEITYNNINKTGNYEYCVYKIDSCLDENGNLDLTKPKCGIYYHVITFMYFDVPIVQDLVRIPINGETRTFLIKNS